MKGNKRAQEHWGGREGERDRETERQRQRERTKGIQSCLKRKRKLLIFHKQTEEKKKDGKA